LFATKDKRLGFLLEPFGFAVEDDTVYIAVPRTASYFESASPTDVASEIENAKGTILHCHLLILGLAQIYGAKTVYIPKIIHNSDSEHTISSSTLTHLNFDNSKFSIL
jgi:hypothetical protein